MSILPQLARASLTSCTLMGLGDLTCQCIQKHVKQEPLSYRDIDWKRAGRFTIVGAALHGPFFHMGFAALDKVFGSARTFPIALRKVAAGQVTLFPMYLATFFLLMGRLEDKPLASSVKKLQSSFLPTYAAGTVFWPLANTFLFRYVPPARRIVGVNVSGLIWNAFLSYMNTPEHLEPNL